MDNSRDSSVWRSLAVAFGDGLAFGVGMKITQNAPAKAALPAAPPDLTGRLARVEQHLAQLERVPAPGSANLDPQVLEALTNALEARLQQIAAQTDRRVAELDVKLTLELKSLRQQDQALASAAEDLQNRFDHRIIDLLQQATADRTALQNQVVSLHREFASAVADIVEEQVATQVEQRLAEAVRAQIAPLERRLDELRQQVTAADRNTLEIMLATSEAIRQAATRLTPAAPEPVASAPPAPPAEPETPPLARAATAANGTPPQRDVDLPGFAQVRKAATSISIPLVTSFLVTAGCVALLQYL